MAEKNGLGEGRCKAAVGSFYRVTIPLHYMFDIFVTLYIAVSLPIVNILFTANPSSFSTALSDGVFFFSLFSPFFLRRWLSPGMFHLTRRARGEGGMCHIGSKRGAGGGWGVGGGRERRSTATDSQSVDSLSLYLC